MNITKYTTTTEVFYNQTEIKSDCNSILFVNTGTTNAIVDGLLLNPGQQLQISGNECELNVKSYPVAFQALTGESTNIGSVTVIRKFFVKYGSYADGRKPDIKNC